MHPADWTRRLLEPLAARVRTMVLRGVGTLTDDSKRAQTVQLKTLGGTLDPVERFGEFGFVSRAPDGAEYVVVCVGGDRSHPIAVASEYREARPKGLAKGEAGLYAVSGGSVVARITLRAGGVVEIEANSLQLAGDLEVDGDITATGAVSDPAGDLAEIRARFNLHTHTHGSGPGTTAPPLPQMD